MQRSFPKDDPDRSNLDRLAVSPQCGFASAAAGNPLSEADEHAKLRRVIETAEAVWKE